MAIEVQGLLTGAGLVTRGQAAPAVAPGEGDLIPAANALTPIADQALKALISEPAPENVAQAAASIAQAAVRQGSMTPLMADLAQAAQAGVLPPPVQAAAEKVLALQIPIEPAPTGAALRQAQAQSGLTLEATLRPAAVAAAPLQTAVLPPPDLKAALLVLKQVLAAWLPENPAPSPPPASRPPPPPYRGGPTSAQHPVSPSLPPEADPQAVGLRLLHETGAALSRQQLLQLASVPDSPQPGAAPTDSQRPQWTFEIPFTTPQGAAVAQFEITRDGGGGPNQAERTPIWRARFSLDMEPLGPVHAEVALMGERAGVTLWAERPDSLAILSEQRGELTQALKEADFTPEVALHAGAPHRPAPPAGRFVDQAT